MIYRFNDGRPSRYPTSLEKALEVKSARYDDEIKCDRCKKYSVKITKTQKCAICARLDAITFYNLHVGSKHVWTDSVTGIHYTQPQASVDPHTINNETWSELKLLSEMARNDHDYTVSPDPCNAKGHIGLKYLGRCHLCVEDKKRPTPRQAAMMKGDKWYEPELKCVKCGTKSLRRVDNGACSGCLNIEVVDAKIDRRETADSVMMRESPDMVLTRTDSIDMGFKVHRTGEPCRKGHHGWRYNSTGNCITCLRDKE